MEPSGSPPSLQTDSRSLASDQESSGGSGLPAKAQFLINCNLMNTSVCRKLAGLLQRQHTSEIRGNRRLWIMFLLHVLGKPSKELSKNQLTGQNAA